MIMLTPALKEHIIYDFEEAAQEFPDDPFALSVASYRRWEEEGLRWGDLEFMKPTDEDRLMAAEMQCYYRDKLALKALSSNKPLPQFKQELYEILTTKEIKRKHFGMLHRLPYLYVEDQRRAELGQRFPDAQRPFESPMVRWLKSPVQHRQLLSHLEHKIQPELQIFSGRRNNENMEYWYRDENNNPVVWVVKYSNPLRSIVDGLWKRGPLTLKYKAHPGKILRTPIVHDFIVEPEL